MFNRKEKIDELNRRANQFFDGKHVYTYGLGYPIFVFNSEAQVRDIMDIYDTANRYGLELPTRLAQLKF